MIGLDNIKDFINRFTSFLEIQNKRKDRGMEQFQIPLHMIFKGPPGTGKTTIARILGKIYKDLGYLKKGHVVEVDRSDLVSGYIGQTAIKTKEILEKSLDGILFIDEAYTLNGDGEKDFGQESIDTIMKYMEDNRDRIIVIVAGYNRLIDNFLESNPGLQSRFSHNLTFKSYNNKELMQIFKIICKKHKMIIDSKVLLDIEIFFQKLIKKYSPESFGNGRESRKFFENLLIEQSFRLSKENVELNDLEINKINKDDFINCAKRNYNICMENGLKDLLFLKGSKVLNISPNKLSGA